MRTGVTDTAAERNAVYSSCCGFLGEAALTDSAVIILFAGMLGAGDMLTMITTSVLPFFNGLFVIPMAWISTRVGMRKMNLTANMLAAGAFFTAVTAPSWGRYGIPVLIGGIVLFAFFLTGFIASWFPLLDGFLPDGRRAAFFGRMRFSHQATAVVFLFMAGLFIGSNPPLWKLQAVLLLAAVIFCGRILFIARLPVPAGGHGCGGGFRRGLVDVLRNRSLMGFSTYLFMLNLAVCGVIPLTLLALKRHWHTPDNVIVILSSVALGGMLAGYLIAGRAIRRFRVRGVILGVHGMFVPVLLACAFLEVTCTVHYIAAGILLATAGMMIAVISIVSSAEMMALASKDNKTLSMAVCGALSYGGTGGARLLGSLLLGSGLLAEKWRLFGHDMANYQALYLIYAFLVLLAAVFLPLVPSVVIDARADNTVISGPRTVTVC